MRCILIGFLENYAMYNSCLIHRIEAINILQNGGNSFVSFRCQCWNPNRGPFQNVSSGPGASRIAHIMQM